jgi:hypothetical protein
MRKVLIGLGLAGALALGFGKTTTARGDDTQPPSQESQGAADTQGAARSANDQANKATYGSEDQADKATNSAGGAAKNAGAAGETAKESSEKANIPRDKTKGSLHE